MAFCNSCGATLEQGTRFCNKCGAQLADAPPAPRPPVPAAPSPSGSSSALKIILIVVGVIVVVGILGVASLSLIAYHFARHSHVSQNGDNVKVETPFGTVETTKDPERAAKDLGVEIYPGAKVQTAGSASATFGGIHTVTANFETDDSVDKVCSFYQTRLPSANVTTSNQSQCTIVSNNPPNMITVNVESSGSGSRFLISSVTKKTASNQ